MAPSAQQHSPGVFASLRFMLPFQCAGGPGVTFGKGALNQASALLNHISSVTDGTQRAYDEALVIRRAWATCFQGHGSTTARNISQQRLHCSRPFAGTHVVAGPLHNMVKLLTAGGDQLLCLCPWGKAGLAHTTPASLSDHEVHGPVSCAACPQSQSRHYNVKLTLSSRCPKACSAYAMAEAGLELSSSSLLMLRGCSAQRSALT